MNDRRAFFRRFFPKWSGFYVNTFDDKIQPVEALQNLEYLVKGISVFWTSSSGYPYCYTVASRDLKLWEVGVTSNSQIYKRSYRNFSNQIAILQSLDQIL
jgi:hypothetical protein